MVVQCFNLFLFNKACTVFFTVFTKTLYCIYYFIRTVFTAAICRPSDLAEIRTGTCDLAAGTLTTRTKPRTTIVL